MRTNGQNMSTLLILFIYFFHFELYTHSNPHVHARVWETRTTHTPTEWSLMWWTEVCSMQKVVHCTCVCVCVFLMAWGWQISPINFEFHQNPPVSMPFIKYTYQPLITWGPLPKYLHRPTHERRWKTRDRVKESGTEKGRRWRKTIRLFKASEWNQTKQWNCHNSPTLCVVWL